MKKAIYIIALCSALFALSCSKGDGGKKGGNQPVPNLIVLDDEEFSFTTGHLNAVLAEHPDPDSVRLQGGINGDDIAAIKQGCKNMVKLDISKLKFVKGGSWETGIDYHRTETVSKEKSIPYAMLYGHNKLEKLILPDVSEIDNFAFGAIPTLKEVVFGKVTSINDYAFINSGIEELKLPEGLQYINVESFYNSRSLKTVFLPSTLVSIYTDSFYPLSGTSSIQAIYISGTRATITVNPGTISDSKGRMFASVTSGFKIYAPSSIKTAYMQAPYWNVYSDYFWDRP